MQQQRQRRRRRHPRRQRAPDLTIFIFIVLGLIFLLVLTVKAGYGDRGTSEKQNTIEVPEVVVIEPETKTKAETETAAEETVEYYPEFTYSKDWDDEDRYLLAKIAMAEAEGESIQGKTLVILVVLNRVQSDDFPDTIEEVLYQERQFSSVGNGRFGAVEPNADCWEAVWVVETTAYDYSGGALYFESCENADNWHSRNLEFLYQEGNHKFYK